ncbi:ABC transporter ATP-binding protein [Clostridium beijerinckii]|uniref:Putative ABC transporter ATP-binding protein YbhF n=1 Tax=Clostridium beijerinckii TaxID=1520 RepID=A0A1S8S091_CLOBE|nr:ABC transporter ATP-binding protein [Clostridium beijerinckii]OOM58864.1 putative ABC transporter ATP-binding protein YbhF [Clostridium beijerinckii]
MLSIIQTKKLTKSYGSKNSVYDINLTANEGEIYGFLGLNGAGKTTTMRMLLKMINPTSGEIYYSGQSISKLPSEFWNQVGYLIETPHAYPNFTVEENLILYARQRLIPDSEIKKRIYDISQQLLLDNYLQVKVKDLSLGNNQKIGLAKALIHKPKILLLDEPTNGLDPEGLVVVRNLLLEMAKDGTTIFISSHLLDEMEKLVSRIGILAHGCLLRELNFSEFETCRESKLYIKTDGSVKNLEHYLATKNLQCTSVSEQEILVSDISINQYSALLQQLENQKLNPMIFQPVNESLEEFFIRTIKEGKSL